MNKYFLSLMSILILFQSFKVLDEILHHGESEVKKGYIIIEEAESETELTQKPAKEVEEINFKDLFSNASLDNGKKISKQCVLKFFSHYLGLH